jgi:hypothetical protein
MLTRTYSPSGTVFLLGRSSRRYPLNVVAVGNPVLVRRRSVMSFQEAQPLLNPDDSPDKPENTDVDPDHPLDPPEDTEAVDENRPLDPPGGQEIPEKG